jgi:uncharacterized protein YfdQ (DUF2303 family)
VTTDPNLSADVATVNRLLALGAIETAEYTADDADDLVVAVVPQGYVLATASPSAEVTLLRSAPRRVKGDVVVTDTASWLAYYGKHSAPGSEVFGDVATSTVTAILNAPASPDTPAWGDHRLTLKLEHSPAWQAWTALNGRLLGQTAFAEHIEDRTPDLVEPDAATMLEVAQSIRATTNVKFESASRLHDGQRKFVYAETTEATSGKRGELAVPTSLKLRLQVWRGVPIAVDVTARFRFRIDSDGLRLAVVLDRLEDVLDAAWTNLLGDLTKGIDTPVLAGRAPNYGGR